MIKNTHRGGNTMILVNSAMMQKEIIQLLEENPNIILRAPLGMIASYLGISQETLSRIRSDI